MKPTLIKIGPFPIASFGVFLLIAFAIGVALSRRRGRDLGLDAQRLVDMALYMIIAGIVAGRVGHVLVNFSTYAKAPLTALMIWRDSGLTFYGALVGGLLVGWGYARALGIPLRRLLDLFAPALALGYAVAMIGALMQGQPFLGRPTGVPWAVELFLDRRHPTQVYLMLASLGTYFVLRAQERAEAPMGTLFMLWLLLQSLARFAVEFFVESPLVAGPFTLAQVVNAGVALIAFVGLIGVARLPRPASRPAPPEMPPVA